MGAKTDYATPAHNVTISKPFSIGRYEVTFGECLLDVGEDPARDAVQDPTKAAAAPGSTLADRIPEEAGGESATAEAGDGEGAAKDSNGKRSKKNADRRDSQIPPS